MGVFLVIANLNKIIPHFFLKYRIFPGLYQEFVNEIDDMVHRNEKEGTYRVFFQEHRPLSFALKMRERVVFPSLQQFANEISDMVTATKKMNRLRFFRSVRSDVLCQGGSACLSWRQSWASFITNVMNIATKRKGRLGFLQEHRRAFSGGRS